MAVAAAVVAAAAAGIAVGSVAVAVAVDAGPDFAGQSDIECYPKTKKIVAAVVVGAAAAIEAVGAARREIVVAKPNLVVVAVSGLRSTILFGIAELERLAASEAAGTVVVVVVAAAAVAAAVRLAEDTEARYLQYWIQSRS